MTQNGDGGDGCSESHGSEDIDTCRAARCDGGEADTEIRSSVTFPGDIILAGPERRDFEINFKASMAAAMAIRISDVVVDSIQLGSLVVAFTIRVEKLTEALLAFRTVQRSGIAVTYGGDARPVASLEISPPAAFINEVDVTSRVIVSDAAADTEPPPAPLESSTDTDAGSDSGSAGSYILIVVTVIAAALASVVGYRYFCQSGKGNKFGEGIYGDELVGLTRGASAALLMSRRAKRTV